jgi:ribosomal protein S18 acetylase RimI-like enzyme
MMEENARLDPRLAIHPEAREHMAGQFGAWVAAADRIVFVAEEGGRVPVGYGAARIVGGNGWQLPETLGEITDCFVIPARRRRGTARRIASRLAADLYDRGISTVRLNTAAKNPASQAFWKAMGYEALEAILERRNGDAAPPASSSER